MSEETIMTVRAKTQQRREVIRRANAKYRAKNREVLNRKALERYHAGRHAAEAEQIPMFTPCVRRECNCHDYTHCMICRNTERRRAWKKGEIPVYRLCGSTSRPVVQKRR